MDVASTRASVDDVVARLERLPTSWWQVKARIIVGVATFFDAFDALAIASVLPVIIPLWKLTPPQIGLMISAGFLGQLLGALLFGWIAERYGRMTAMVWSIALFAVMSLACALAWDYNSLLALRTVQGIGLGGEVPVAAVFISELAKAQGRGRFVLLYELVFPIGLVAASLAGLWVVPHLGWQYMFVIGALPALLALVLRSLLPESPRWLAVHGRHAEAEAAMSLIEAQTQKATGAPLPPVKPVVATSDKPAALVCVLLRGGNAGFGHARPLPRSQRGAGADLYDHRLFLHQHHQYRRLSLHAGTLSHPRARARGGGRHGLASVCLDHRTDSGGNDARWRPALGLRHVRDRRGCRSGDHRPLRGRNQGAGAGGGLAVAARDEIRCRAFAKHAPISTLAKSAAALQRGVKIGQTPPNPPPGGTHALIEIDVRQHRCRALRRERGAERRARQDPHVLGRPGHQLGLHHPGEEGPRAASRQVLHDRAGALRRHPAHGDGDRQRRARSLQPRLFDACHRDRERRHGGPAHHRR